jgi:hypothetical protein
MYEFKKKFKAKNPTPCKKGSKGCPADDKWYVKPPL